MAADGLTRKVPDWPPVYAKEGPPPWVTDLKGAYHAYWHSKTSREEQAAYHEILLFGGKDDYPSRNWWRPSVARLLRQLACWIEREGRYGRR